MPACANGASLAPGAPDQFWLDKLLLLSEISGEMVRVAPWAWAQYAAELHDTASICAKNPDPPAPLTAEDIVKGTAMFPFGGLYGTNPVLQYLADYALYAAFLRNCVCNTYVPPDPSHNCIATASFVTPGEGQAVSLGTVTIDQQTYNSWGNSPGSNFVFWREGSVTYGGGGGPRADDLIQLQLPTGQWLSLDSTLSLTQSAVTCSAHPQTFPIDNFPLTAPMQFISGTYHGITVSRLDYCFCGPAAAPPPNNPPATGPTPPAPAPTGCTTDDICTAINELNRRLNFLSAEISDLLAAGGAQTLTTLATQPISGEGRATLVVGTRAVHVALDAVPPEIGHSTLANPDELFRVGTLRWFDGAGYTEREHIDAASFSSTRTPGALEVTWALRPGVTAQLQMMG